MNPEEMQPHSLPPDEAAAALGFATNISEQLMPKAPVEGSVEGENAPGQEQSPNPQEDVTPKLDELKTEILDEIATLREEVKKSAKGEDNDELEALKKEIEEVINSDE